MCDTMKPVYWRSSVSFTAARVAFTTHATTAAAARMPSSVTIASGSTTTFTGRPRNVSPIVEVRAAMP